MAGRILGIDLGDRWVGLALSDPLGLTAQPLGVIDLDKEELVERLGALVEAHGVAELVVGLPRNMDGSVGPKAEEALALADRLQEELELPVSTWDERLSTARAERALSQAEVSVPKRKKLVDAVAAQLILQAFLDSRRQA